jgi:hypothetical protein
MCEKQFISGDDVTESDLDAAERGELIAWRRGPDGVQWFKRTAMAAAHPLIQAVPDDSDDDGVLDADDGDDEDPVADQAEVEGFAPINFEFGEGVGDDLDD